MNIRRILKLFLVAFVAFVVAQTVMSFLFSKSQITRGYIDGNSFKLTSGQVGSQKSSVISIHSELSDLSSLQDLVGVYERRLKQVCLIQSHILLPTCSVFPHCLVFTLEFMLW